MADPINTFAVKLLRRQMKRLCLQMQTGEKHDCAFALLEVADEADDLKLAIRDRVPEPAADEYWGA